MQNLSQMGGDVRVCWSYNELNVAAKYKAAYVLMLVHGLGGGTARGRYVVLGL